MRFSRAITFLLIACALTTSIIVFYYSQRHQKVKQNHINHAAQQALHQLSYGVREYANIQDQLFSIIHLLSHSQTTCDYAFSPEPNNQRLLEEAFASVAHYQKWYNSIVFFDNEGQANVGVMYSATESSKVISHAPDNQLSSEVNDLHLLSSSVTSKLVFGDGMITIRYHRCSSSRQLRYLDCVTAIS